MKNLLLINGHKASIDEEHFHRFHGNSVFTTFKSKDKTLPFFDLHYERLHHHADYFNYNIPPKEELLKYIYNNLKKFNHDIKIRIILSKDSYAISLEKLLLPHSNIYDGVDIIVSKQIVHPVLRYFKTANSLPYMLALEEAQEKKAFEALLLDHEGFIADGSRSGILIYKDHELIEVLGGLKSIMRHNVILHAKSLGLAIKQERVNPKNINGQILLCNSLFGVVPVKSPKSSFVKELIAKFR